jgi:RNA polymerase sigma-70 factor (ECF subfamily)
MAEPNDITRLLQRLARGDQAAGEELAPQVTQELHRLAAQYLRRERPGHTLQATALVNEAYIRLAGNQSLDWQCRQHFFGLAAQIMRRILTDYARRKRAGKRGGGALHFSLDEDLAVSDEKCELVERLDPALRRLQEIDGRAARVVELRFFGGLKEDEIAELMEVSPRTVTRLWQFARAWLLDEISPSS